MGEGNTNRIAKFLNSTEIGNSQLLDDGSIIYSNLQFRLRPTYTGEIAGLPKTAGSMIWWIDNSQGLICNGTSWDPIS